MSGRPNWMDHLHETLDAGARELSAAVDDRSHGFRTFSLASVDETGSPRSRIVVLRSFDPATWQVAFHADRRSDKIAELDRRSNVALLFYDADRKLQIRIEGTARVLTATSDAAARVAFSASQPMSRVCYRIAPAPGTAIDRPDGYRHHDAPDGPDIGRDPGLAEFVRVVVGCDRVEILYLHHEGHRRSRFVRGVGGSFTGGWLVP